MLTWKIVCHLWDAALNFSSNYLEVFFLILLQIFGLSALCMTNLLQI
ncbi:hypothetical protein VVMO6_01362 [Vibrio vulnificus MO6-24/O]|nr:hypothetical protein VVMO6_01362 [Vibrio vulnificus MO6-24/O]